MPPRVSVVVPAYNNAAFLAETLQSVLDQTFTDFELIVADHASTDDTWSVMERFAADSRVRLLHTPSGGGALANWNRVSKEATGEYLKLLPGDDVIFPAMLEKQVAALDDEPAAVLAASSRSIIDAAGGVIVRQRGLAGLAGSRPGGEAIRKSILAGTNLLGEPGCVLLRRGALEQAGWWDSRWPYLIDQATYAAVLLTGRFVGVGSEPLAAFRLSDTQWSVRLARQQSEQAAGFHRWMGAEHPNIVSARDVQIGNARARAAAVSRRLVYLYLGRRMRRAAAPAA